MQMPDGQLTLHQVTPQQFDKAWPLAARWLAPSLEQGDGAYTIDQLRLLASQERAFLLVFCRADQVVGALIVEIHRRPQYTVASVLACGGRHIIKQGCRDLTLWAKAWGCSRIEALANGARLRLYESVGFQAVATVIQYKLES